MLISKFEVPLQKDIPVFVEVPDRETEIQIVIHGVWNQGNRDPDYYNTGFRIVDPTPESINVIYELS